MKQCNIFLIILICSFLSQNIKSTFLPIPTENPAEIARLGLVFAGGAVTGFAANVLSSGNSENFRANICGSASAISWLGIVHLISSIRTIGFRVGQSNDIKSQILTGMHVIADGQGIQKSTLAGVALTTGYLAGSVGGTIANWATRKMAFGFSEFLQKIYKKCSA